MAEHNLNGIQSVIITPNEGKCGRKDNESIEKDIREFILNELHSGATIYKAIGAYRMQERNEIITIVDRNEYQKLMAFVDKLDPHAFVTVYKVSEMQYRSKALPEREFE